MFEMIGTLLPYITKSTFGISAKAILFANHGSLVDFILEDVLRTGTYRA